MEGYSTTRGFSRVSGCIQVIAKQTSAEETQTCGAANYFPSQYTCYNNSALCPKAYSLPTVPCAGSGGCYSPRELSCSDGVLRSLSKASSPFTLTAHGVRAAYQNKPIKACGGYLAIGANARECTSCPAGRAGVNCASYGRKTVLMPGGAMVLVALTVAIVLTFRRRKRQWMCPGDSIGM